MEKESSKIAYLKLLRFCGEELYPIESATWHYHENEIENTNNLFLDIQADYGYQLSEDTKGLNGQPHWELSIPLKNLKKSDLVVGFKTEIQKGYAKDIKKYLTNFYYCDHGPTDNNHIEIIEKKENQLLLRLTGEITDVNYYDGSKPKNKILVETWFKES